MIIKISYHGTDSFSESMSVWNVLNNKIKNVHWGNNEKSFINKILKLSITN